MNINPLVLGPDAVQQISKDRAQLATKVYPEKDASQARAALAAEDRSLGLAHEIFTLGLYALTTRTEAPQPAGVRVLELKGQTPTAFYDIADARLGQMKQMSATSPYPALFAQALDKVAASDRGTQSFDLRLLRVPALNFEALWLHTGTGDDDMVVPLREFHGFTPMLPIPYKDALERLREPAERASRQDDAMGS